MFIHSNIDSLRRMYKLFMRIDTKNIKLQESMYKYIRAFRCKNKIKNYNIINTTFK